MAAAARRYLFIIPKMFTKDEFGKVSEEIPSDFDSKCLEFWQYVREKVHTQHIIQKVYYDSLTEAVEDRLKFVKEDNESCYELISELMELKRASLEVTEDKISVSETRAWMEMVERGDPASSGVVRDLLNQAIEERNRYVANLINSNLKEAETALFFVSPDRSFTNYFAEGIRVIRIQPFDPMDYLNSWLVTLRLRKKSQKIT